MAPGEQRVDDLDRYYKPIKLLDAMNSALFWVLAVVSVAVLYVPEPWNGWILTAFVVLVFVRFVLSQYVRLHLLPNAENRRRSMLVSNALSEALIPEEAKGYFNNPLEPSIQRLGANVMENAYFGKEVCEEMARSERMKIISYVVVYVAALVFRNTSLDVLLVLTQTVFSVDVVAKAIDLEVLRVRSERVYDGLYRTYLNHDTRTRRGIAEVLDLFAMHEAAKAEAGVRQSTRVFNRLNPQLSTKWEQIRTKLEMGTLRGK